MSDNELPELPELVVLTGAGFSKAFGLPLASEFNTMLYNRLIDNKELTRRIIEERNFEQIYTDLQNEKSEHFKDFEKAVEDIFNNMHPDKLYIDDSLKNSFVNNFLKHYLYPKDKKLADKKTLHFFTLNQDILFESHKISHLRGANSQENKIDLLYPGLFHICAGQPRDFKNTSIEIKRKTKNEVMSEVIVNDEMFSEEYKNQEKLLL